MFRSSLLTNGSAGHLCRVDRRFYIDPETGGPRPGSVFAVTAFDLGPNTVRALELSLRPATPNGKLKLPGLPGRSWPAFHPPTAATTATLCKPTGWSRR